MRADPLVMARGYLLGRAELGLTEATCGTDVPDLLPRRFVRLLDSGSTPRTVVHRDSRVTEECWNKGGPAAAKQDAEDVYAALDEWDLVPVWDGWPSGPYAQPDPITGTPRYVMTCLIRHRMEA